ncbi:MAG: hypothetical protein JWO02_1247 [Solirubrobacterales bacterium]|nr:hypothetical protein [Solirubrobacterales bacterium]
MRVHQLRALVLAKDYRVDPRLVAEAFLRHTRGHAAVSPLSDARSPSVRLSARGQ